MSATRAAQKATSNRVSTLELFFDLVFVFAITQVSDLILHAHGAVDVVRAFLALMLTWWIYGGYAWLTNSIGTERPATRALLLAAMAGFLVMALALPQAFGRDGMAFGLAYLAVNVIHSALFTQAPDRPSARGILRITPFNVGSALIVIAAALSAPALKTGLWVAAVGLLGLVPFVGKVGNFAVQAEHFVERHGLVLIIALGESIISIGLGAAGEPVTLPLVSAVALSLGLSAAIWWSYFARDEHIAERALSAATGTARARMALYAFGFGQLVMIAGIVLAAAGIKRLLEHLHEPATLATCVLLGAGIAVYLIGDVLFRRLIGITSSRLRVAAALASIATILVGLWAGGIAQVAALLLLFVATLSLEHTAKS
jgi:low temperature requirement protein LtrA